MHAHFRTRISPDHHLLERLKFSGIDPQNLADLVVIVVSLKNKYGIWPFAAVAQGRPVPNALYDYLGNGGHDRQQDRRRRPRYPRLKALTITPRGIPKSAQFEADITLGD